MIKSNVLVAISEKVAVLEAQIAADKEAGKSIGRTKRSARALKVIASLIDDFVTTEEFTFSGEDDLMQMIDCKKGHRTVLQINRGDKLMDILTKYANVPNIWAKIQTYVEEHDLEIVLDHIE